MAERRAKVLYIAIHPVTCIHTISKMCISTQFFSGVTLKTVDAWGSLINMWSKLHTLFGSSWHSILYGQFRLQCIRLICHCFIDCVLIRLMTLHASCSVSWEKAWLWWWKQKWEQHMMIFGKPIRVSFGTSHSVNQATVIFCLFGLAQAF